MANYLDKNDFLQHIEDSQQKGYVTDELANDWIKLIDHLYTSKWFNQYSKDILDDMKGECLYIMVKKFKKYDCNKNTSPFSYFTTLVFNTSYNVYYKMKKQWEIQKKYTEHVFEKLKDEGLFITRSSNGKQ